MKKRVAILKGGNSVEREVSFLQVNLALKPLLGWVTM